jgi:predicted DNA-binding transcriptional regulator YafY
MSYQKIFDRHSAIIEFMQVHGQVTVQQLMNHLAQMGDNVGVRTVQRALQDMELAYNVRIIKHGSHPNHTYSIEQLNDEELPLVYSFLEHARMANLLNRQLSEAGNLSTYVFPDVPYSKGLEWLPTLLKAIQIRHQISFEYAKFQAETTKREVKPYFLKQFRKRWYLMATDNKDGRLKSFGLDRMAQVNLLPETFHENEVPDGTVLYRHAIGLNETGLEPLTIQLWSEYHNAHYLRTLRLHQSQRVVGEKNNGVIFELHVVPNYEFFQEILRMSSHVRILSPNSVRQQMKEMLLEMLSEYE